MTPSFPEPSAKPAGCSDAGPADPAVTDQDNCCPSGAPAQQQTEAAPPAADSYKSYFGVSPDNIIDLPDADSFTAAIEKKLRLPQVAFGKKYECVIKLFTLNNSFAKRIQLHSVKCLDRDDFSAELDPEKRLLYIHGTARAEGEIRIKLVYLMNN